MTAFTPNSGSTVLWDSLSGGSVNATLDTYTISNNTTLKIDVDSYHCANHTLAFGSVDTVSFTGIGGRVLIDATQTRVIAYTVGSGTVPAFGTTISQGGVTGVLAGVWANWLSEPVAVGAAMPVSGFIKLRSKAGGSFAIGVLTGISATASGPDVVGWIEVRGADTATITVPRIGKFETLGDWFEIGTTTGVRGQVLACPTTATIAGVFPGVWIETAAGSGVYEQYAGCGSMVNLATNPTDERGKIVWQIATGIRIGSDGTNNVGFLPPTGCRVRIPNVILTCCTRTASGSGLRVLPNATLATRQEFVTTSAGDIQINYAVVQWNANFLQAFKANVKRSAVSDSLILQEIASLLDVDDVIVSPTQAQLNFALNMLSCFAGGVVKDSTFARFSLAAAAAYINQANYNKGVTFLRIKTLSLLNRGNATTGSWTCSQNVDCVWTDPKNIGGRMLMSGSPRDVITNHGYADNFSGATTSTNPQYAVTLQSGCAGTKISGWNHLGLANVHPYSGLINPSAVYDLKVRNIGSFAAPLDFGSANASGYVIASSGNNDNIKVQRVFVVNTRTGNYSFVNSDNNVTIEQLSGDFSDPDVIASLNTVVKGVSMLGATAGQVSVYGTHWKDSFTSATVGKIEIICNEATTASAAQCVATGGTPRFNSAGQVALTTVGDEVTWEMPYFAKGHTALANLASTNTGTNPTNLVYEFQYDKGSGYNGAWLVLNAANLTGAGAIDPAIGVKLKVRARCGTANSGNLLTNIAIPTVTTSVAQGANLYPIEIVPLTFNGIISGSRLFVEAAAGGPLPAGTVIYNNVVTANPLVFSVEYTGTNQPVNYRVRKGTSAPYYRALDGSNVITDLGMTAFIQQFLDT